MYAGIDGPCWQQFAKRCAGEKAKGISPAADLHSHCSKPRSGKCSNQKGIATTVVSELIHPWAQLVELRAEEDRFLRLLEILGLWYEKGKLLIFVGSQEKCDDLFRELLRVRISATRHLHHRGYGLLFLTNAYEQSIIVLCDNHGDKWLCTGCCFAYPVTLPPAEVQCAL